MLGLLLSTLAMAPDPQVIAAQGVLQRTIGRRASDFQFERIRATATGDQFVVSAEGGKVTVKGTSGVAMCRGAYEYLKDHDFAMVTWEGSQVHLPARFPDQAPRKGSTPAQYRHYYNICTFGYTTAFWDWTRWRREIDWMALHGINMPLAMTGQDEIWRRVFTSFGVPQTSLDQFFSGPAFQPWHWMGNLNGHGGPAPQSWLDGQVDLQKKILGGERELGMKPVVPGFSGFVPTDFAKFQPQVRLQSPTAWCGFAPTTFVDIRDPMFVEIGKRFVQEYRKQYGTDHLYLCDTFNEQNPQFPAATKLSDLANAGRSVYEGLREGDPDAVWVMQGWLFYNERDYWGEPEIEALLSKVPDDRMIILDLSCEQYEVWRRSPAVAKKGFIYCTLHNFGQNTGLGGDPLGYAQNQAKALKDTRNRKDRRLLGFGLTPEGIDQNPVVYELMTDAMWGASPTAAWIDRYADARYGGVSPQLDQAWRLLFDSVYSKDSPWYRDAWRGRPGKGRRGRPVNQMNEIEQALRLMLEAAHGIAPGASPTGALDGRLLAKNPLFQRDLVDVCKTWLGGLADRQASLAGDPMSPHNRVARGQFLQTLDDIDQVMACRPEHRLTTWIAAARKWGKTDAERRLMERNARLQITAWDGRGVLTDYANKEWAGLTKDFLERRWEAYFDGLDRHIQPDYLKLEMAWVDSTAPPVESKPADALPTVARIFAEHAGQLTKLEDALGLSEPPGNLARAGAASDDGHTEPVGPPANAIDGDLETYWSASPYPCEWRLDLKAPKSIKTIQVFPYWGDDRYYQYVVEVSVDGKKWRPVIDWSANTTPSSPSGDKHVLASPVTARYLRVRMLKNSANVGVHLCEVRVYDH